MLILGTDQDKSVRFRNQRWWAEKGLICLEDQKKGEFETMTVRVCLQRLNALSEMVGNSRKRKDGNDPQLISEHINFFEAMINVCKEAQNQGRPDLASHQAQMRKERQGSSRLTVSGGQYAF